MSPIAGFSGTIGIVTGIAAEARIARRLSGDVACSGCRADIAEEQARRMVREGATALMSFGIAGGLASDLAPGALILADAVVTDAARYSADARWAEKLGARVGTVFGGFAIVSGVSHKAVLAQRSGAIAVDLESGAVARVAAEAQLPCIVLRAISDPASRGLPPAALLPLSKNGGPRLHAVLGSVIKKPGQIPGLMVTAADARAALRSLLRASRVLV